MTDRELMANEWRQIAKVGAISLNRTGWRGAWDAVIAAATNKPRRTVNQTVTFSVWVKADQEVRLEIAHGQVEVQNND